jgi:hypothetical protein
LGARVIATAGGDDKLDFCRKIRGQTALSGRPSISAVGWMRRCRPVQLMSERATIGRTILDWSQA